MQQYTIAEHSYTTGSIAEIVQFMVMQKICMDLMT